MNSPNKARIILRYTYRNHLDEIREFKDEFASIHDFKNYLRWHPERAIAIGYLQDDKGKVSSGRASNVRLSLVYRETETFFRDAHEFVQFLRVMLQWLRLFSITNLGVDSWR